MLVSLYILLVIAALKRINAFEWDQSRIEDDVKPCVVSITKHTEIPFEGASVGEFFATGFVVDSKFGVIATNKHVSGTSPSYFQVSFYDGTVRDATVLWYDPMEDFAFLRVDVSESLTKLSEVSMGDVKTMQAGDDVLLVGNNEGRDFSIKTGQIASLYRSSSSKRNLFWQTTFDRTGGASGSPVFNSDFDVVAIHAMGSDTTSMELPISLLSRVLKTILKELDSSQNIEVKRGDVGARFSLESVGNVARYYGMDSKQAQQESKRQLEVLRGRRSGSPPCVPVVVSIVPGTKGLSPGDVILKANGQELGCDLSVLADNVDKMLVQKQNKIKLDVFRLGKSLSLDVNVNDAEEHKIDRFLQIAGAVFHEVTPTLRLKYVGALEGIWLAYASPGSAFDALGISEDDHPGYLNVLIQGIKGQPVRNLDEFVSLVEPVLQKHDESSSSSSSSNNVRSQDIFVTVIDYKMDDLYSRAIPMSVESSSGHFDWNYDRTSQKWKKAELSSGVVGTGGTGGGSSSAEKKGEIRSNQTDENKEAKKEELSSFKSHSNSNVESSSSSSSTVKVFRSTDESEPDTVVVETSAKTTSPTTRNKKKFIRSLQGSHV